MSRTLTYAALSTLTLSLLCAAGAHAGDGELPGMVFFDKTDEQPVGMDAKDLERFLIKELDTPLAKKKEWKHAWEGVFLYMTPRHTVSLPAFHLGKYEVTNAQWMRFLKANEQSGQTSEHLATLGDIAASIWQLNRGTQGRAYQKAWNYLMRRNADVVMPHLNPTADEKWDSLVARADDIKLPKDITLHFSPFLPPEYWIDGIEIPAVELARPARYITFEAAMAFCDWAGLHVPREHEWEHAARGVGGRRFAWGDDWNPQALVWNGYNAAIKTHENALELKIGDNINNAPPHPVRVDDPNFQAFCTPEGIQHMSGNVAEWVLELARNYEGSETTFIYENFARMARGGGYTDLAEIFLAADRTFEGAGGAPLTPTMLMEGYGLRTAAYAQPGRDLVAPLVERFKNKNVTSGPWMWLPYPPGLKDKQIRDMHKRAAFVGLDEELTVGQMKRDLVLDTSGAHVYVNGPAKGIALLPTKGLPNTVLKAVSDLTKAAEEAPEPVLLGLLTGTRQMEIELLVPKKAEESPEGTGQATKTWLSMSDDRLQSGDADLLAGRYRVGVFLVLRGKQVAVYSPDPSASGSPQDHLKGKPLGFLEMPWTVEKLKAKDATEALTCTIQNKTVAMTIPLPPLDANGNAPREGSGNTYVISIRFRVKDW